MRVAIVNGVSHASLTSPEVLLLEYRTLTGWGRGLRAAGVGTVQVVQRFRDSADVRSNGVAYAFRSDRGRFGPSSIVWRRRMASALIEAEPDVIHVNGTGGAADLVAIRRMLPESAIVVQHHGEGFHRDPVRRGYVRRGLACADAVLFSSAEQAEPWRSAGLIGPRTAVFGIVESSTTLRPMARAAARAIAPLPGSPAVLWVGRLNDNKDPLTVLRGFEQARRLRLSQAHLTFVYQEDDLLARLRQELADRPALAPYVHLHGRVDRSALPAFYSAADVFVLGSHREGSGYALIEALACGAAAAVTDIAPFRAITAGGRVGALWMPGSPAACGEAIVRAASQHSETARLRVRTHFERTLAWDVIGQQAVAIYRQMIARRIDASRTSASPRPGEIAGASP